MCKGPVLLRNADYAAPEAAFPMVTPGFPQGGNACGKVSSLLGHRIFLFEQCSDVGCQRFSFRRRGFSEHVRDTRMAGESRHLPTCGRDRAFGIDGSQSLQQAARLAQAEGRRRSHPRESLRLAAAPCCYGKHGLCKVGFKDFRLAVLLHSGFGARAPETVANARGHAAGSAGSLPGHVPADAHGLQPAQAILRVEHRLAAKPGVDDYAHVFYGKGSLCYRRSQDDFPVAVRGWHYGPVLYLRRQHAVERMHFRAVQTVSEQFGAAPYVRLAGQEGKYVAFVSVVRQPDGARHRLGGIVRRGLGCVMLDIHREHPSFPLDEGCIQLLANGVSIDGGRHDDYLEVGTDNTLCLTC